LESLRNLFADLNFEYEDKPVDKQNWNEKQREIVVDSRIVARKDSYLVYYIKTNSDSIKAWKEIATKIISANNGLCLVCSHNPSGFQWIFSSISKEFTKSFTETRHIPIEIKPSVGIPKPFLEFLEAIRAKDNDKGINILNKISDAFDKFSLQIHDELTINVFEALKVLSEGIIIDKSNKLKLTNETLENIRGSVFILLYRIIFVLYAEDRSIFPLENEVYYEKFSLRWIKHNWILKSTQLRHLSEYAIHNRLKNLFKLIENGSEGLGYNKEQFFMRSYYGRLFDSIINHDLDGWLIPNQYYLKAVELLTSTKDRKGNRFFLDYAALEIRHLGSIYEHLLEFHLTVYKSKIADLPNTQDRKLSGSYYTPQYIVEYIVKNSIGPIVDEIVKKTVSQKEQIDKILSLNILDPAMGSGHFLVGATEYLAKRICEIENKINPQNYVERKRDVVRRCIYGVDLNPLAVDLAALSLWLETLSSEKPLSFLSAHLKVGNSLVGSKVADLFEQQTTLFESQKGRELFDRNVKEFLNFEYIQDDTAIEVRKKIHKYDTMQRKGTIYYELKFLLDSKLAVSFGVKVPNLGDYRAKVGENSLDFYSYDFGPKVKTISDKNRFFHWELEFLDIFYGQSEPGFDIIIGNPPYVNARDRLLDPLMKSYIDNKFETTYKMWDMYVPFVELGLKILRKNGILSMIIKDTIGVSQYTQKLVELIESRYTLTQIDFFPEVKVFQDAGVENKIIFVRNNRTNTNSLRFVHSPTITEIQQLPHASGRQVYLIESESFAINRERTLELGDICFVTYGLRPSSDKNDKVFKFKKEDLISEQESAIHKKLYTEGKYIDEYVIEKELFIEWDTKRSPKRLVRRTFPELYDPPKLLMSRQKRVVAFSDKRHVCDTTIVIGVLMKDLKGLNNSNIRKYFINTKKDRSSLEHNSERFDLKYILGLLNSNLIKYYLKFNSAGNIDSTPDNWKSVPIKDIPRLEQQPFKEKVDILLLLHKENHNRKIEFIKKIKSDPHEIRLTSKLKNFYATTLNAFISEIKYNASYSLTQNEECEWEKFFEEQKKTILSNNEMIKNVSLELNNMIYILYDIIGEQQKIIEERLNR